MSCPSVAVWHICFVPTVSFLAKAHPAFLPDETEACCALVRKSYLRKLAGGEREKVLAALARRGFGYGAAKEAVERCLLELEEEREDFE